MQQRVMPRDVDRVRRKIGQAANALMRLDEATGAGELCRAKRELGTARGALDGIERMIEEMEFHAENLARAEGRG